MSSPASRIARSPRPLVRALLSVLAITICFISPCANAQSHGCSMESQRVFSSAFSTHRAVLNRILRVERRGRWRPDGTFRVAFLSRNARALRNIRNLLSSDTTEDRPFIRAFNGILSGRVPAGASLSKSSRTRERVRFSQAVQDYLTCRLTLGE